MQEVKVGRPQHGTAGRPRPHWLGGDSTFWLGLVALLFLAAELTPSLLRMPLGADEIGYIAQLSIHHSGVQLPPVHGQGVGLLAAPVTLLTTSLVAIRVWMAVLSAVGLFLGMLCWRGLRPAWVLALAGFILGSLAITQNSGVQIYPDWWAAVGLLVLTGLFLQAVNGRMRAKTVLPLIAVVSFFIILLRPQNIVFVMGPAILAVLLVPGWRKPKVLGAMAVGAAAGAVEWIAEAYAWYGGLGSRIHLANQEPPTTHGFSLYFSFPLQVKVLSGPWYCTSSAACPGWNVPGETLWFIALLALAVLGLCVAWRREARASAVLTAASAVWGVACYSFLVPFGAPRYILPSLALLAILAADGIGWLVTEWRWQTAGVMLACAFLLIGVVSQRFVLSREISYQTSTRPFQAKADKLIKSGVRPPCVVSSPYVAYYVGCTGPWSGESVQELLARTPGGVAAWRELHDLPVKSLKVYIRK